MSISVNTSKVVHLTTGHPASDIRIFYKQCSTLRLTGYKVILVAPHKKDEIVNGVFIKAIPVPKNLFTRLLYTTWKVFIAGLKENAYIYHLHDPELLLYGQLLRVIGKQVIYDMHENMPKTILTKQSVYPCLRGLLSKTYKYLERLLLTKLRVIFAEKSYYKDYAWVKSHTTILNMPKIDSLVTIKKNKYSEPTIGYIGSVTAQRGSDTTLSILHALKNKGKAVKWQCVGQLTVDHKNYLTNLAEKYKLQGIYFHGYRSPEDGWEIIAGCHIGIALLKPIPNYLESYPTKIFEYMALGLPVITSDFPLYKEIVENSGCGFCINPDDYEAAANIIDWLITNPQKCKEIGERGYKAVIERYNWDAESKKLLKFYREICAG